MRCLSILSVTALPLVAAIAPMQAQAQEGRAPELPSGPPREDDDFTVTVGIALLSTPSWRGSNDSTLSLVPDIRVDYKDEVFASLPEGLGWNAIKADGWKAGPLARVRFGRSEESGGSPFRIAGGSDDLLGMGDISASGEVGGFVEKRFGESGQWRIHAELLQGFGGHNGLIGHMAVRHRSRIGAARVTIGPRITVTSRSFMNTYYGIDEVQSANTGLPTYKAGAGILDVGLGGNALMPLSRRSGVTFFATVETLGEEAADSPIVKERGSRLQFAVGLGYGYRFGF